MSEMNKPGSATTDQSKEQVQKKKGMRKKVLGILGVVVIIAAGIAGYTMYEQSKYFVTENAKVTADMYYITPLSTGELLEWQVSEGDTVEKDQHLGRLASLPYLTSPIAGTIVADNGIEGQMVSPSTTLAIVADTAHQYIGVNVEETDISNIEIGQKVDVSIDAFPGKTFSGVITNIDLTTQTYFSGTTSFSTSGTYTKVTQLIPIKVVIENPENAALKFGMNATVKIHIAEAVMDEERAKALAMNDLSGVSERIYTTTAEAVDQIAIIPSVSGKVNNIYVNTGDVITSGDLLFSLDDTDRLLAVNQADANYRIAVANYESTLKASNSGSSVIPLENAYQLAKDNYNRTQALYDEGAVSAQALDSAQAQMSSAKAQLNAAYQSLDAGLTAAKAQVDAAAATLEIAKKSAADCIVEAPMAGVVTENDIAVGDMISSQTTAMTVMDASKIKFAIDVTEVEIGKISDQTNASVYIPALEQTFDGKVSLMAPASTADTGLFSVEISTDNGNQLIKPGMSANVTLLTE